MTEEEAKTKWCPMVRLSNWGDAREDDHEQAIVSGMPHNRQTVEIDGQSTAEESIEDQALKCIGSACMMWRGTSLDEGPTENVGNAGKGYCGLAGKP